MSLNLSRKKKLSPRKSLDNRIVREYYKAMRYSVVLEIETRREIEVSVEAATEEEARVSAAKVASDLIVGYIRTLEVLSVKEDSPSKDGKGYIARIL